MANGWKHPNHTPRPRKDKCINGHDLTDPDNVAIVQRKRNGKIYKERQCLPCRRKRSSQYQKDTNYSAKRDWKKGPNYGKRAEG